MIKVQEATSELGKPTDFHDGTNEDVEQKDVQREVAKQPSITKNTQKWLVRGGVLFLIGLIAVVVIWLIQRPVQVEVIQPVLTTITETITSSGRVGGTTETNVGAQSQGVVQRLLVKEGDDVIGGQQLAMIKNDVAEAQILQAQAAVNTARSQLVQASRGSLPSDIDAVYEQVRQANAQVEQQKAMIIQAEKSVQQARSQLDQLEAERDLTKKNLDRSASLVKDGIIAQAEYDQALTNFSVADKRVESSKSRDRISAIKRPFGTGEFEISTSKCRALNRHGSGRFKQEQDPKI